MILKAVVISILACGITFAGEAEVKLPASVKTIMDKTERDISKNKEVFETANDKVFSVTEKALKVEMEKFTKAGKLEEALIVKNLIENMRKDVITKINEKKDDGTDLLGDTTKETFKIGAEYNWKVTAGSSGKVKLTPNGFLFSNGITGILISTNNTYTVKMSNGYAWVNVKFIKANNEFQGDDVSPEGKVFGKVTISAIE